jgi:predicted nucleic acid-binding protein
VILDAGALVAVDRNDRAMIARLLAAHEAGDELRTHPLVVAQVWRDASGRQAVLARFLKSVEVVPIDGVLGRRSGELLGRASLSDPVDAALVLVAEDGDTIVTSDPADISVLAAAAGRPVLVVAC